MSLAFWWLRRERGGQCQQQDCDSSTLNDSALSPRRRRACMCKLIALYMCVRKVRRKNFAGAVLENTRRDKNGGLVIIG